MSRASFWTSFDDMTSMVSILMTISIPIPTTASDFRASGTRTNRRFWQIHVDSTKSRLEMRTPTKSIFVIEHQEPRFKVTRTHTWGEKSNTLTSERTTDGEEHYRKDGEVETWTRMTWLGEELVLDMKLAYRGEQGTNVVHYRLADEGKTLVAAEWYHMPRRQHHNLWVFDRMMEE